MPSADRTLENLATPAGTNGVYVVPLNALYFEAALPLLHGRPITAVAPHPFDEDRCYITTAHPETLAFLPEPYIDLQP